MNLPFFKSRLISEMIRKKREQRSEQQGSFWLKKVLLGLGIFLAVLLAGSFLMVLIALSTLPDIPSRFQQAESTIIYDREGNILYTIHGEENRQEIPLNEIPKHVIDATIAIEDDQFFEHYGFDIGGIIKGFFAEYLGLGKRRGGSTITQQLVKNTILSSERTLMRKIKELLISLQLERTYSKNEILALYLNTIPYGSNAYGIEMAARVYFAKHAKDLTLAEAAILASLPQAPSRYNPYGNGKELLMGSFDEEGNYVTGRKDVVLARMKELGYITEEQYRQAFEEAGKLTFHQYREKIKYPHFVITIKELLENKFGKEAVETGGLHVYTTIDPLLQDKAEAVIAEKMKTYPERYGATNAALLTVDLEKGYILAMVGSADYFNETIDGNVNVVFRHRLPGSSFKPMVYATGFLKGYSPATVLYDLETNFGNNYIPQDYDGKYRGPISARKALGHSLNIPAVQMTYIAGIDHVIDQAKKMGITDLSDSEQYGLSLGLGTGEVTIYQMVTAFSVFAKGGNKMSFTPFLRIETSHGTVIESNEERVPETTSVLDPQIAYTINHILSDKSARFPGWDILVLPDQIAAAKTGTSNKRLKQGKVAGAIKPLDNWTIGYTTKIATGVWIGNSDATPLNYHADGLTTAAPIWNAVMREATKTHDLEEFPKPEGMVWKKVSKWSGLLPSKNTREEDIIAELFTSFNIPTKEDDTFLSVQIDKVSKKLPTEFTPPQSIVEALVTNFHSLNPTDPNWETPIKKWAEEFIKTLPQDKIILSAMPKEKDDIHTAESEAKKPTIRITSPNQNTAVPAGSVEIQVSIEAPHGVDKVEYFVDQRLVKTTSTYPFTGKIRIPRRSQNESIRIGATVSDSLAYSGSDVINISVSDSDDTQSPETSISYPEEGAFFPPNTTLTVETSSRDNISIAEVTFYLDDRLMGRVKNPPYRFTLTLPEEIAEHTISIIAQDVSGNTAQDTSTIRIEEEDRRRVQTGFLFPKPGSAFGEKTLITFFFQLGAADQRNSKSVKVVARSSELGQEQSIYQTQDGKLTDHYSFSWTPGRPGSYECFLELTKNDATVERASSIQLTVE